MPSSAQSLGKGDLEPGWPGLKSLILQVLATGSCQWTVLALPDSRPFLRSEQYTSMAAMVTKKSKFPCCEHLCREFTCGRACRYLLPKLPREGLGLGGRAHLLQNGLWGSLLWLRRGGAGNFLHKVLSL